MVRVGISARWTSSLTTCLPSSRAEKSLKEVPALTKGVRRPATIATRRPGREAMRPSLEVARVVTATRRGVKKHLSTAQPAQERYEGGVSQAGGRFSAGKRYKKRWRKPEHSKPTLQHQQSGTTKNRSRKPVQSMPTLQRP